MNGKLPIQILLNLDDKETPILIQVGAHTVKLTGGEAYTASSHLNRLANIVSGGKV